MKIRGMRWGYDGGRVACGPVPGNTIVEICVTAPEKRNFFVTVSQMMEYEHVYISPIPTFDLLIHSTCYDVDSDAEYKKVTDNIVEEYDYEVGDEPAEMHSSAFAKVIHLARLALQEYSCGESKIAEYEKAEAFIAKYVDKNIDTMELPELEYEDNK